MTDAARITVEQFERLLRETIPLSQHLRFRVDALGAGWARVTLPGDDEWIRAGGTVSGPAIMALADTAFYGAVLTRIGLEPMAVTSDLSVRFLRRPPPDDLRSEARLLRLGKRQAVAEVRMWSGSDESRLVAHATGTYALPPPKEPRRPA
ncbi:MAG TPA: PaaI family thioesterase [Sandaracinaceae bacterium LLY-WYZ-13_1]|nr:PaaI family thioesterase [Sandaracinaceae bacterium LLY-WYZ-13_1]